MHWEYTPYALPLFIAAGVSIMLALFAWRRRPTTGATSLAVVGLGAAEWSLAYAVALGIGDLPARIFLAKMQHIGIAVIPLAMLVLVLRYTARSMWLTRRRLLLLSIVPLIGVLLVWTNEAHGLIWADIRLTIQNSVPVLDLEYGVYFWIHAAYGYILLFVVTNLLFRTFFLSSGLQRHQSAIMLGGVLFPWAASFLHIILYFTDWNPFPRLDLMPFSYSLTGLVMAWGLFRYRLLDIVPVARDRVVESMSEGVIVLDMQDRIADLNAAAQRLIDLAPHEAIGKQIHQVFSQWPELVERYRDMDEEHGELTLGKGEAQRYYHLLTSPLDIGGGHTGGRLILLHDITERKCTEQALKDSYDQIRALSSRLELAREEERAHLAHEIHDELGHALTALKFDLSSLDEELSEDEKNPDEIIKSMGKLIDRTLEAVKRISSELRPALLDVMGLGSAIEQQAEEFQNRTDVECMVNIFPEETNLDKDLSTTIFRIFQEALTNVARHAKATKVWVDLDTSADELTLQVVDNGRGITEEQISSPTSFGLLSMRERLSPWGGEFKISGGKDNGTTVNVEVPLSK